MIRHSFIIVFPALALTLFTGPAFAQTQPPGKLSTIFHSPLSTRLASADTVAVSISQGGIVPIYSSATTIQPGSWISIYGSNLASGTLSATDGFPTTLGGTSVTINNKPAYLYVVTPGQIDAQAPDDTATGTVAVQVKTATGSATSTVALGEFGPSFTVIGGKYVTGVELRTDGSGAYGNGTYDIIGPTGNSLGFPTVAAKAGDILELFAVGFGPTSPSIPSGQILAPGVFGTATTPVQLIINGVTLTPSFVGIVEEGLFQLNLTLPAGLGTGDVPIIAMVGGVQTQTGIVISLQ